MAEAAKRAMTMFAELIDSNEVVFSRARRLVVEDVEASAAARKADSMLACEHVKPGDLVVTLVFRAKDGGEHSARPTLAPGPKGEFCIDCKLYDRGSPHANRDPVNGLYAPCLAECWPDRQLTFACNFACSAFKDGGE